MPNHASDQEIMQRIEKRDQAALTMLYQQYGTPVYSLAYRIMGNSTLAEEVTQDTFLKVWHATARWDASKGRLSSWLLTITRYTAIDRLRKERRQNASDPISFDLYENLVQISNPYGDDDGRLLRSLLSQLPEEQAQVIKLAFFQGYTHMELAEHLNLPLGTVKTRVRLGLQKLKALWIESQDN